MNNKNIAILSVADLRHMTCVNYFCEYLSNKSIKFDIICMNRYFEKAKTIYECGLYQFDNILDTNSTKLTKMKAFLQFRQYAAHMLKENQYDFIIVWGENAACLFFDLLQKKKMYCVNVRDYFDGPSKLLRPILDLVNKHAKFCTVPSPRGLNYLKGEKYLLLNKDYQVLKKYSKNLGFEKQKHVIRITYMGVILDYIDAFKRMLLLFKNDSRFEIHYYGKGADSELACFAKTNGIKNVVFGGGFSPEKTAEYLENTDIINSVYGNTNYGVEDAVGVKESYAPLLHIPVLSDKGCFFSRLSEDYGFGLGVTIDTELPDKIYEWYMKLNVEEFNNACNKYTQWVDEINRKVELELDKYMVEEI